MSQRKPNTSKQSGTPTKINISPSHRSPLTASKFNPSNSKPSVSYGQLQIVLENIQEIRRKASQQIVQLERENQRLREELGRSQQEYEDLSSRLNRSSNSKNDFEFKVLEQLDALEGDKRTLETQIKERAKIQTALEAGNRHLESEVSERDRRIAELEKQLTEWETRWTRAFTLLAGDATRSQEVIWKVKNHGGEGIWGIINQNTVLAQQLHLAQARLEMWEREVGEMRQGLKQSTSLLEKSMSEVTSLNLKLSQLEQQHNQLREKCLKTENELSIKAKDYRLAQTDYEARIGALEGKLAAAEEQKQKDHYILKERVAHLQEDIAQKTLEMAEKQKHEYYAVLISEVCQEGQDYCQLLERVRYLQKFRTEHYSNVQKLQYLCKMLDY